jgi:hypothetical protein
MKSRLSLLAFLFLTVCLSAQTVDEIVAKHLDAIGGKDVLSKTTSLYAETNTSIMGNDAPGKRYILQGKGYKNELELMGNKAIQCVTTKAGWASNPMNGEVMDLPEEAVKGQASNLNLGGVFADYAANGTTVELITKEKLDKADVYKMKVTPKGGQSSTFYIDATTYHISRMETKGEMMGQEVEVAMNFKDYKKLENGYVLAHTTEVDMGQFQMTTTVTKAEVNKVIEESIFDKPK